MKRTQRQKKIAIFTAMIILLVALNHLIIWRNLNKAELRKERYESILTGYSNNGVAGVKDFFKNTFDKDDFRSTDAGSAKVVVMFQENAEQAKDLVSEARSQAWDEIKSLKDARFNTNLTMLAILIVGLSFALMSAGKEA
jgi:hypothetical protein